MAGSQLEEYPTDEIVLGVSGEPAGGLRCPECGSRRIWKDGLRLLRNGEKIQRYICRICGYRFSGSIKNGEARGSSLNPPCNKETPPEEVQAESNGEEIQGQDLNIQVNSQGPQRTRGRGRDYIYPSTPNINRRVCAWEGQVENSAAAEAARQGEGMATAEPDSKNRAVGDISAKTGKEGGIEGKLVEYLWWMKRQGYADETIRCNVISLKILAARGADLYSPESVKDVIARQKWSGNRRKNVINAYSLFLKMQGGHWEKPRCNIEQKIPFIPTEQEIDALIAGSSKRVSILLQLLKETAMRVGEAMRLEWTDIDFERRLITLNRPEKRSNPRVWRVSNELLARLKVLPRTDKRIFGDTTYYGMKSGFLYTRKRLAHKLQNPRLERITFHTIRHWKATMLYHQTKDPYYVKQFLGHKSLRSTDVYITIERSIFGEYNDEFTVKVASKPEEIKNLLETGFDYVCEKEGLMFFRKRK